MRHRIFTEQIKFSLRRPLCRLSAPFDHRTRGLRGWLYADAEWRSILQSIDSSQRVPTWVVINARALDFGPPTLHRWYAIHRNRAVNAKPILHTWSRWLCCSYSFKLYKLFTNATVCFSFWVNSYLRRPTRNLSLDPTASDPLAQPLSGKLTDLPRVILSIVKSCVRLCNSSLFPDILLLWRLSDSLEYTVVWWRNFWSFFGQTESSETQDIPVRSMLTDVISIT